MFRYHIAFLFLIIFRVVQCQKNEKFSSNIFHTEKRELELLTLKLMKFTSSNFELNCISILCDEVYLDLFTSELFHRIGYLPYIMIVVKQSEDLLSPNFDTLESLKLVRQEGCKFYVIFLANGLQTSRLLKFGDRHRILDTRAKYLILHDFRLFQRELHYLWRRYINVLFLRHFVEDRTRGERGCSWFELSTIPYPPPDGEVLFPRRITTWKSNRRLTTASLYLDKSTDLKDHTLRVAILDHIPAVVRRANTSNFRAFYGIEIEIIRTVSKVLNFNPVIYEPEGIREELWGGKQFNGSFSGLLGEMVDGRADIGLANLHYTPYHLQLFDLTIPYISQCLTFLTPESLTDNSWKTLVLPFKLYMWIAVLVTLFMSGFIFYGLAIFHRSIVSEKKIDKTNKNSKRIPEQSGLYVFEEITNSILYTYGMLLVVSLPKLPPSWPIRLLTGWYWLYCVLVVVSYRASMTAILANPAPRWAGAILITIGMTTELISVLLRVTIDTMEELAESSIDCGGWGDQGREFFFSSLDEAGQKIGAKFKTVNDVVDAVKLVADGDMAYYENEHFLKHIVASVKTERLNINIETSDNRTESNSRKDMERRDLHIMRECAISMPISIGLQKNSPIKPKMDRLLRRIVEAGLVAKWLDDTMGRIMGLAKEEDSVKALMNLQKLYGGFVALGIGYLLSVILLIAEIIHWNQCVKKDPNFDEYDLNSYYKNRKNKILF